MRTPTIALCTLLLLAACGGDAKDEPRASRTPPDQVTVDHILIGVQSPGMPRWRPAAEARALAYDLLGQLQAGADWATLKRENSDDPPPGGPYTMLAAGRPNHAKLVFLRAEMAKCFGDVGFALNVDEIGMADYDPQTCKFGYHIIKRIK